MSATNFSPAAKSDVAEASHLRALLDAAVDAIVTIDESATILGFNPAAERLFGHPAADVEGRNVKCLMPKPWAVQHDEYIRRHQRTGEKRIIGIGREVEGLRKDGTVFPMHLAVGEYAVDGRTFYTAIIHDLTRRKEADDALANAQKMEAIGHLTGGIAHDFNNLLTVIMGNLELLELQMLPDVEHREMVEEALEAAQLGASLTERLLTFARRTVLKPETCDLNELVDGMSGLLKRSLGEDVALQIALSAQPCAVRADRGQIETALLNLAVNARDAMPKGGALLIETASVDIDEEQGMTEAALVPGRYARVTVTDDGFGMSAATRARAFEPFFTTKDHGKGTGLGLSMVHGFARQSGGDVTIATEAGKGTRVAIYLPLLPEDGAGEPSPLSSVSGAGLKGVRVLVVEDDAQVRRLTLQRLAKLDCVTVWACTGDDAFAMLQDGLKVDVVFTDIVMPGSVSGYDLARIVRDHDPTVQVLLTSGYAEELVDRAEHSARGLQLLRKPYRLNDLSAALRAVLNRP